MKKTTIYIYALLICSAISCTKNFSTLNKNPAQFTSPDAESIFTGAVMNTTNKLESNNFNWLWEYGHLIEPGGQRYNVGDDGTWNTMFTTVLGNTRQLKNLYQNNPAFSNRVAIADIWECYVYAYLVGTYGPIPYSQAGVTTSPVVNYDDENTVYTSLLSRLKADAAAIKTTGDVLSPDVIFGGNLTQWIKFANSLRLRLALRVQQNLPALAASNITELMANENMLLTSDADDPKVTYALQTGSQSPYYIQYVQNTVGAGSVPVMSDYVFTYFRSYSDPRIDAYFVKAATPYNITDTLTSTADSKHYIVTYPIPHLGAPKSATVLSQWSLTTQPFLGATYPVNYSTLPPALTVANRPFYLMTYAEVCFMKAEAAALGYQGTQTADTYYYAGINANFAFWGLTTAQATTYEAQNGIKWNTAGHGFNYDLGFINTSIPNNNLSRIWIQEWLNYFDDGGFDAWTLQRRTQNLSLPPHTNPGTPNLSSQVLGLPDRWPYPNTETSINPVGNQSGVKELGGLDYANTELKIEPPYTAPNYLTWHAFIDYSFVEKWYGTTIQSLTAAGVKYTVVSTY
jgi:hypothetical protein